MGAESRYAARTSETPRVRCPPQSIETLLGRLGRLAPRMQAGGRRGCTQLHPAAKGTRAQRLQPRARAKAHLCYPVRAGLRRRDGRVGLVGHRGPLWRGLAGRHDALAGELLRTARQGLVSIVAVTSVGLRLQLFMEWGYRVGRRLTPRPRNGVMACVVCLRSLDGPDLVKALVDFARESLCLMPFGECTGRGGRGAARAA
jgi:hypothetical protein